MIIETPRLILRPFRADDAADVFEYLAEPQVHCFAWMKLNSLEEAKAAVIKRSRDPDYYFAITLRESGKVIGEIFAYPETGEMHAPENSPLDTFSPSAMLNSKYHKQGYACEAGRAFLDYLFRDRGARRVYIYTDDYNVPSQQLCEKLGMRKEGFFREIFSFVKNPDGTPHYENTYQYAILKKEWLEQQKALKAEA